MIPPRPRRLFASTARTRTLSYAISLALALTSSVTCKIVKEVIDDSDSRVSYTGVGWTAGQTSPQCPQGAYCPFTIDTTQVYQGTWHDNTGIDNITDVAPGFNNASLSFTGTAISVTIIEPGFKLITLSSPTRFIDSGMQFFVDGEKVGDHVRYPGSYGADGWLYNYTVFQWSAPEGVNADHEVVVQSGLVLDPAVRVQQPTILLDSFTVSFDDGEPEPSSSIVEDSSTSISTSASESETASPTSTPESTEGRRNGTNTVLIVAPIVSILVVLILIVAGIIIYMKRRGLGWSSWLSSRGFSSLGSSSSRSTQTRSDVQMLARAGSVQSQSSFGDRDRRFTDPFSDSSTEFTTDAYTDYAGTVPPPYDESQMMHRDLSLDELPSGNASGRGGSNSLRV